ncbi:MAG: radical SAM protein [Deltaproteobacteria bacterium]|nr:radical SAM protein [Deltaproteobacteria bacterium]
MSDGRLDVAVLVTRQEAVGFMADPNTRRTAGASLAAPYVKAYTDLCAYVGRPLTLYGDAPPSFRGKPQSELHNRSLAAVTLATAMENAGLRWEVIDPPSRPISYWREQLALLAPKRPRVVAFSTTFVFNYAWLAALCVLARRMIPEAKIIVGGYFYVTDSKGFLALPADVLAVGEGEVRLPQIVRAVKEGGALEEIPGIYLRRSDGELHYTGKPKALDMNELAPLDWRLAERCSPPALVDEHPIQVGIETQRGCLFMCEFCTYRMLAKFNMMDAEVAAARILDAARTVKDGVVVITDATATFPRDRWLEIMRRLAEAGGSPHPIWIQGRVSDINEESAELMYRAGVREMLVGMESGDQRILNAMRKGTRADQVKPALAAFHKHGLKAYFNFICGFPGETDETYANTHRLILSANDGFEDDPPLLWYNVDPFLYQDFSSITRKKQAHHADSYEQNALGTIKASESILRTVIATSSKPSAPVFVILFHMLDWPNAQALNVSLSFMRYRERMEIFRWLKKIERGISLFLERDVNGRPLDMQELRELKRQILAPYPQSSLAKRARNYVGTQGLSLGMRAMRGEWKEEQATNRVGPLTRVALAALTLNDGRNLQDAVRSLREGRYVPPAGVDSASPVETGGDAFGMRHSSDIAELSRGMIKEAEENVTEGKRDYSRARKMVMEDEAKASEGVEVAD